MNELICPNCGRANPITNNNCQYCQALLESPPHLNSNSNHENPLFEYTDQPEEKQNTPLQSLTGSTEKSAPEKEEPEWLKRIRELKQADEQKEKEREQWRQQTLFNHNEKQKNKHKLPHEEKKVENLLKNDVPQQSFNPNKSTVTSPNRSVVKTQDDEKTLENKGDKNVPNEINQDLPEGFTPINNVTK